MAVMGLGHVGYYVKDLEVMKDFWGNFMGMTLTKSSEGAAFYSADPKGVDHEIAIMQGRPEADDSHLIQQISHSWLFRSAVSASMGADFWMEPHESSSI